MQRLKAEFSMEVTVLGIMMCSLLERQAINFPEEETNKLSTIVKWGVTQLTCSVSQPQKGLLPMVVTVLGMVTLCSVLQSRNAESQLCFFERFISES